MASEGRGWTKKSFNKGVNLPPDGWSGPANVDLTPMPMINNATASVHAAITKVFQCDCTL